MTLSNLNFTSIAGLTAVGAIVATSWRYVSRFGRYVVGIFIGTAILKDDAGAAAMSFAFSRSMKSPIGTRLFGGYESYVHPKRWHESVAYEGINSDPILIKYKKSYALVSLGGGKGGESSVGVVDEWWKLVYVRYFRWSFNIEQFTIDAIEHYNSEKRQTRQAKDENSKRGLIMNRFKVIRFSGNTISNDEYEPVRGKATANASDSAGPVGGSGTRNAENLIMTGVYRLLKWSRQDLQLRPEEGQSAFTGYPFPKEIQDAIKELELWLTHEKWFRSKSIPWRRGWLLHGIPGTGKSTLVRALGMSFDLPVYVFDLASMNNDRFARQWDDMLSNTPCIALIEDIDNIFDGRKYIGSVNPNISHLTFDCLLNCISGVKQADGVFLVITTNHLDKLDPAIGVPDSNGKSSRPGRIDRALHLGLMEREQRSALANFILSDYPDLIDATIDAGEGETAAQFQSRCAQIALGKFWSEGKPRIKETYQEVAHFEQKEEMQKPQIKLAASSLYGSIANSKY